MRRAHGSAATSLSATILPPAASYDEDEEDGCPVCYKPFPLDGPPAPEVEVEAEEGKAPVDPLSASKVLCKVCKHAVCVECDKMLTKAGHERCPMCRAPRPKRSTLPVQILIHAFHCPDTACERPQCTDTKLVLLRMEVHAQNCAARELTGPEECKVRTLAHPRPRQ